MREQFERWLKLACLLLAAALLFQVARIVLNRNPLAHIQIPALPTLVASDAPGSAKGTNAPPKQASAKASTNAVSPAAAPTSTSATNSAPAQAAQTPVTNSPSGSTGSNVVARAEAHVGAGGSLSNSPDTGIAESPAQAGKTNFQALAESGKSNSTSVARTGPVKTGTNSAAGAAGSAKPPAVGGRPEMAGGPRGPGMPPGMPGKAPEVPPEIWARVDRVTDSEILGQVMHPLPMALLGIAGEVAFLRTPSGQTGLVKPGDDLGGVKLLRIGINRILVEEAGQKKELMIFNGLGGESLLPKEQKSSP